MRATDPTELDENRISPPAMHTENAVSGPATGTPLGGLEEETFHSGTPRALRALQHADYRNFWIGNFLSNIGTWMQNIAQGWLVLQLTNSAFWLGLVGFCSTIPLLLFTLIGGVIADHVNRRKMLMITQSAMMVFAFVMCALAYLNIINVEEIAL